MKAEFTELEINSIMKVQQVIYNCGTLIGLHVNDETIEIAKNVVEEIYNAGKFSGNRPAFLISLLEVLNSELESLIGDQTLKLNS